MKLHKHLREELRKLNLPLTSVNRVTFIDVVNKKNVYKTLNKPICDFQIENINVESDYIRTFIMTSSKCGDGYSTWLEVNK